MLVSPFKNITQHREKTLTKVLSFLTCILIIVMLYLDSYLVNDVCKNGIVSFQLAKNIETSEAIINSWNETSKISAGIGLGLDFLFLLIYPTLIAFLMHKMNRFIKNNAIQYVGIVLIFAMFFAAAFDIIENIALIQLLLGCIEQFWSSLAFYFAVPKFIIILLGISYILFNFVYLLFQKRV